MFDGCSSIGSDTDAAGPFPDALASSRRPLREAGFEEIGIGGYAEGDPGALEPERLDPRSISDSSLRRARSVRGPPWLTKFSFRPSSISRSASMCGCGVAVSSQVGIAGPASVTGAAGAMPGVGVAASLRGNVAQVQADQPFRAGPHDRNAGRRETTSHRWRLVFVRRRLKARAMRAKRQRGRHGGGPCYGSEGQLSSLRRGGPVAEEADDATNQPPFRADHVGSLLRTAPVKEARAKRGKNEITRPSSRKSRTARSRDHQEAGRDRPQARHRRRIPPLLVAFRLLRHARRRRDLRTRPRHPVPGRADQGALNR